MREDLNTINDLVRAIRDEVTGGYHVDFTVRPNEEWSRTGNGFWLVVDVHSNQPDSELNGQWWFYDDGIVLQVV